MAEHMVRICKDCGTIYSESKKQCESCGTRLSDPMDNSTALRLSPDIKYNRSAIIHINSTRGIGYNHSTEYFEVTRADEIAGTLSIIGAIGTIAIIVWGFIHNEFSYSSGVSRLFLNFFCLSVSAAAAISCFFPNFSWDISTFTEQFFYKKELEPSELARIVPKVFNWIAAVGTVALVIFQAVMLLLFYNGIIS